jgi:hypothetical protein
MPFEGENEAQDDFSDCSLENREIEGPFKISLSLDPRNPISILAIEDPSLCQFQRGGSNIILKVLREFAVKILLHDIHNRR